MGIWQHMIDNKYPPMTFKKLYVNLMGTEPGLH
jgi:hypothetical protein